MPSPRYSELDLAVEELRKHLLPRKFSPTGDYRLRKQTFNRAASFCVLCHSEVESYIEDRAIEVAQLAQRLFKQDGTVTRSLVHLTSYSPVNLSPPSNFWSDKNVARRQQLRAENSVERRIGKVVGKFVYDVRTNNHGVRERNLANLLIPIGFLLDEIDPLLLTDLDELGVDRGHIAHSSRFSVARSIDPKTEYERAKRVVRGLLDLDATFDALKIG